MEIKHDSQNSKFIADVNGAEATIVYKRGPGNCLDLLHTVVPPEAQGKGVASDLVRAAIETAKRENVQVVATCPYVQKWFEKHPEEQSLLAKKN